MLSLRDTIQHKIHGLVGFGTGVVDLDTPRGDQGLFGPRSVTWVVHADFTAMMVGGVASVLLQMLHPAALAGVWDHSDFRRDMEGRLRRTAQFVSGTTFAATAPALSLIERVRAIHAHVRGTLPDGTPYSADDPDLLTWIHVAEMSSFLASHLRYRDPRMPLGQQDRYFAENAAIAERLGARHIPTTRVGVDTYLREIRPQLRFDHRTRNVAEALFSQPAPSPILAPFRSIVMQAGIDLLPDWAAEMHGLRLSKPRRLAIRANVLGAGLVARWAIRDSSARRAKRRTVPKPHEPMTE